MTPSPKRGDIWLIDLDPNKRLFFIPKARLESDPKRANITAMDRSNFTERTGKLEDLDRSFDIAFWQAQNAQARFDAAWELVTHAVRVKGNDVRQLRLQRTVEHFQKK